MIVIIVLVLTPFILMLAGFIKLLSSDAAKRKTGKMLLLAGFALLGVEILIGYSVCSNIHIGGGH